MITVKATGIDQALQTLKDYPEQLRKAKATLVAKGTEFAFRKMQIEMASAHDIPPAVLVRHRRIWQRYGAVWVGYNPLPAGEAGNPVKTTGGVFVNGVNYPGAFIVRQSDGNLGVFARDNAAGPRQYGQKTRTRQPIHQIMLPLDKTRAVVTKVRDMTAIFIGGIAADTVRGIQ